MMIAAQALAAAAAFCAAPDDATGQAIASARADFNRALDDRDIDAVRNALAEDVLLVTGTDSIRVVGREAQIELWNGNFAEEARLIYRRTPDCVTVSMLYPIALETGSWRGAPAEGSGDHLGGRYSAKWRREGDRWVIESEHYLTADCGGALCPATEAQVP